MQSRLKAASFACVILTLAFNGLAYKAKAFTEHADDLLVARKFHEAAEAYRKNLDSDQAGKAHVGLILSLVGTRKQQVRNEVRSLTGVTNKRWPKDPIILSCAAYVAYQESRAESYYQSDLDKSCPLGKVEDSNTLQTRVLNNAKRADDYSFAAMGLAQASLKGNPDIPKSHLILALVNAQLGFRHESRDHLKYAVDLALQLSEAEESKEKEEEVLSTLTASLDKGDFSLVETDYSRFLKSIGVPELDYPNIDFSERRSKIPVRSGRLRLPAGGLPATN